MILTCPKCETQYFADDATIGDHGRTVKCAACGNSWFVPGKLGVKSDEVDSIENEEAEAAIGAHNAYRRSVREKRRKKSRLVALTSWGVSAALFFGVGAATILMRNDIVKVWPQSASAYTIIGFDVNQFGLDFTEIEHRRTFDGTTPILNVSGRVVNVSNTSQSTPDVRVGLRDDTGREVAHMLAKIQPGEIKSGDAGTFVAILESPPVDTFDLELSFVQIGGQRSVAEKAGRVEAADPEELPEVVRSGG